jgi:hypothetical protein
MFGINLWVDECHLFEDLMFYFVLKNGLTVSPFPWNRPGIQSIANCFLTKTRLGSEYFPFLVEFAKRVISRVEFEDRLGVVSFLSLLYAGHPLIVSTVKFQMDILELTRDFRLQLNPHAVLLLGYITSLIPAAEVGPSVCEIPLLLLARIEQLWPVVQIDKVRLHEIPDSVTGNFPFVLGNSELTPIPARLYQKSEDLNRFFSPEVRDLVDLINQFIKILHSSSLVFFLDALQSIFGICSPSLHYQLFAIIAVIFIRSAAPIASVASRSA